MKMKKRRRKVEKRWAPLLWMKATRYKHTLTDSHSVRMSRALLTGNQVVVVVAVMIRHSDLGASSQLSKHFKNC